MESTYPNPKHLRPPPPPYRGWLKSPLADFEPDDFLSLIRTAMEASSATLSKKGETTVTVTHINHKGNIIPLAMKRERPQSAFRSYWMAMTATRAKRAFVAADLLFREQHLCPEPLGYIERLHQGKVAESVYISRYLPQMDNFRDALIHLYKQQDDIGDLLPLLKTVAQAMRRFHDTGLVHNDMGNQNILLQHSGCCAWESVRFVDLDHTRLHRCISLRRRAYDVSRINLPDGLLTLFKQFYFNGRVSTRFDWWEKFYRWRFEWHRRTRMLRHPVRTMKRRRHADRTIQIPLYRNIWFFDPRSVQAIDIFGERLPKPPRKLRYKISQGPSALVMIPSVIRSYKRLRAESYQKRIELNNRLGLSLELDSSNADCQLAGLNQLPPVPVHINLYRHQNAAEIKLKLSLIEKICRRQPVVVTLVQDRLSVNELQQWDTFCRATLPVLTPLVEGIQIGRAVNRGHWGIWSAEEYHSLLDIAIKSVDNPHKLPLMGPGLENGRLNDLVLSLAELPKTVFFTTLTQAVALGDGNGAWGIRDLNHLLSRMTLFRAFAGTVQSCAVRTALTQFGIKAPWKRYYRQLNTYNGGLKTDSAYDSIAAVGKLAGDVTEVLCSGMVDQAYLHLPINPSAQESAANPFFTQFTPPIVALLNHWLAFFSTARFISRRVTGKGIHCLTMEQKSGEKVALVHSPGGPQPLAIEFDFDKITDYQGNAIHITSSQIEIAQKPFYFHNANLSNNSIE